MTYQCLSFTIPKPEEQVREILIAYLNELGYEAFEETKKGLNAWIKTELFQKPALLKLLKDLSAATGDISYDKEEIEEENWNQKWESQYDPVILGDQLAVIAPFHTLKGNWKYILHIQPKMSFGTGHHATTKLMLQYILEENVKDKTVLDMGSGTGVLSILCEIKGSRLIEAIDIDPWANENIRENLLRNNCHRIKASQSSRVPEKKSYYDIILANINRNILLEQIPAYSYGLKTNGVLIISGFLPENREILILQCKQHKLILSEEKVESGWLACRFEKQNS